MIAKALCLDGSLIHIINIFQQTFPVEQQESHNYPAVTSIDRKFPLPVPVMCSLGSSGSVSCLNHFNKHKYNMQMNQHQKSQYIHA